VALTAEQARTTRVAYCTSRASVRVSLMGGFAVALGDRSINLPATAQRVVMFLALHPKPLQRAHVSGTLWPNSSEEHAAASLRSALWRLHRLELHIVDTTGDRIRLASDVRVDFQEVIATSRRLIDSGGHTEDTDLTVIGTAEDLLPDVYDDWLLLERERFRQLRIHALEALCDRFTAASRFAEAVDAGLAALVIEPTRESAHRFLIKAHLAEGNPSDAVRQYRTYLQVAARELGISPSPAIQALVTGLGV
jgi:DNA-binding SARP family transcriptional activator